MRIDVVLSVMNAEVRLTRRLVRYWVFLSLAMLSGLLIYLYYSLLHAFFSSYSGTAASIGPRFLIGAMGLYFLAFFMAGLVFLAYDVRARDVRERMVEVLDARPISNIELLVGRFFAQVLLAWIPAVIMVCLMQILGVVLPALGAPFGATLEPWSLVMFTLFMCIPAFTWALGLTYLVTLLVRHRLVAAVLTIAILVGVIWASFKVPSTWIVFFDIAGMYAVQFPSDILPSVVDLVGLFQRLGVFLAGLGFLGLAVAVHPRLDGGSRAQRGLVGGVMLLVALGLMGAGSMIRSSDLAQLDAWQAAHEARFDELSPDVLELKARADIDPGGRLGISVDLLVTAPPGEAVDPALFSLNPGLMVGAVSVGDREIGFKHSDGLLELDLVLQPGEQRLIHLEAEGKPDMLFGYLDGTRTPERLPAIEAQLYILGWVRGINDRRFVALMPGIFWLPTAGTAVSSGRAAESGPDFFDVDLEVIIPEGWLAAGPGTRRDLGTEDGRTTYRFLPGTPVGSVAVVASKFESHAADISGVRTEILMTPGHSRVLEDLAEAGTEIKTRIADRLEEAAEAGFAYPYDGFTLVEGPNALRGFGGGWRLDSVLAQPGMMIVRELGFPLARFDVPFRDESDWQDREGGTPRAKMERLEEFFINDFSGGNLFSGVARSFLLHQCAPEGRGREAVDWTLDELGTLLLADTRGYFSAHLFTREMGQNIGKTIQGHLIGNRQGHFAESVIEVFSSRPDVWQAVLGVSLADMDPWDDPQRSIDALSLKAGTLSQALYDDLGFEGTARFLGALRENSSGGTFALEDFVTLAEAESADLGPMIRDVLTSTDLPGLVGQEAEAFRLPDSADGSPQYQLRLVVRNDESSAGMFRVVYYVGVDDDQDREESDPIRIKGRSAVEFNVVLTRPPTGVWVDPYIAFNRTSFRVPMAEVDEENTIAVDPVEGTRDVPWVRAESEAIVIDDLDDGFTIVAAQDRQGLRLGAKARDESELDGGLPADEFGPIPREWSRASSSTAYGRYRHTVAWMGKGKGKTRAEFNGLAPKAGLWDLEIHLPHKQRFRFARKWGMWKLAVVQDDVRQELDFDASAAPRGWNLVDAFDLVDGEVIVEFSDATTGMIVVADAIRWTPAAGAGVGEEAQ
ncbi:MAG: ABC transporter permease [Thermoanaerobaculales bacterium]|nr:ABC transporter permease [Thermoanaerobaculales bacterium]